MNDIRYHPHDRLSAEPPSDDALAAWRHLRDEGGWWTARELGIDLLPGLEPGEANVIATRWLFALYRRGLVAVRVGLRTRSYGVTARCLAPAGESMYPNPSESALSQTL